MVVLIVTGSAIIDHLSTKKLPSWLYHNYLYYRNKIFITTTEFNGLSSAAYILNGRY